MFSWIFYILTLVSVILAAPERPHIVFIIADDLGWNDVGFHGSGQVPTPNIDALAYSGLILNRYYVTPICTPSRSALMTGKYPIHTGMQHGVLKGAEPRGLPLQEKLLPEYLRELGYRTHIVGKWHLGFHTKNHTPTYRGFESHLGYWTGHQDYYDHTAVEEPYWGMDMRRNLEPAWDLHGQYSTDVFTREAVRLINSHNDSQPLFLYFGHVAVHSANPYNPLPVADEVVERIKIPEYKRRRFAAIASVMDSSVGAVVEALEKKNMLRDSIIVFTTDNGGPAEGFNLNAASNWPLRGVKDTYFEGGVRGAGLIWSTRVSRPGRVSNRTLHIVDWLPTLVRAAGGNVEAITPIDGLNAWEALAEDKDSPRTTILHNIDDIVGVAAIAVNEWKLIKGPSRLVGDISEMPLKYVTGNMPVTNRLEYMGQGSTWSRPPLPSQESDSTPADPEEDDDIEVIYDSEFGPYPPPLRSAHPATDIYGGFQDWNWHLPSSTTTDELEPAFYAGSNNGDDEDEEYQMPTSTSADETEPEITIVYDSRLDESQSAEMEQDDELINGTTYKGKWDQWYGPSGRDYPYDLKSVVEDCPVAKALKNLGSPLNPTKVMELRNAATVQCGAEATYSSTTSTIETSACNPLEAPCLFNIIQDPCERHNLAGEYPDIVKQLEEELAKLNATAIPPGNLPWDKKGNPALWDHTWNNFGDYESTTVK